MWRWKAIRLRWGCTRTHKYIRLSQSFKVQVQRSRLLHCQSCQYRRHIQSIEILLLSGPWCNDSMQVVECYKTQKSIKLHQSSANKEWECKSCKSECKTILLLKSEKWKLHKCAGCQDGSCHISTTRIFISYDLGYKLRTGYQGAICTPDSSGAVFLGISAPAYHQGKNLCVYDTELVRFQPQRRRKWRLHLPLCCQSVWIWSGPQCFMPSQVQVDRQDMPWNYIIIISLVYSSVCLSKSFHSLSEVSFSSLRSLHRLVTHSYLFSVHQIYFDKG